MDDRFLQQYLQQRKEQQLFRELPLPEGKVDLCSNDFLGFAREEALRDRLLEAFEETSLLGGGTGSRLISGNSCLAEELEIEIAEFHEAETALLFTSGYTANVGSLASLAGRHDTLLYDEQAHASIRDGARLSRGRDLHFRHNDPSDLRRKMAKASGRVFVVVESVYSMGGPEAPLRELLEVCEERGAYLIVDEAHAVGTSGMGRGVVAEQGLEERVFARVVTFGKALGAQGAAVLGSSWLREYCINFSRSFIYTTALPVYALLAIRESYRFLKENSRRVGELQEKVALFRKETAEATPAYEWLKAKGPVQAVIIPGNELVREVAAGIRDEGFEVRPILAPTVPQGTERIRVSLHWHNTEEELRGSIRALATALSEKA